MSGTRGFSSFALRKGRHEIALHEGKTVVGRSADCSVILDGALVSRRHAVLEVAGGRVFVRDLDSRNGTSVNGKQIRATVELSAEDVLLVGDVELQLLDRTGSPRRPTQEMRRAQTMTVAPVGTETDPAPDPEEGVSTIVGGLEEKTQAGHALELLASVIDKFFALGKGADAKRLLETPLNGVWYDVQVKRKVEAPLADRAADYGVRLAEATDDDSWVVKVLDIFEAQQRPLPLTTIDRLYSYLRHKPGESRRRLAPYVKLLQSRRDQFTAAEAFALKRLEGLLRIASL